MTTNTELAEKLSKLNSDFHKISEKLTAHIASKKGCEQTVEALKRGVWGNGKPGMEENIGDIKKDVAVIQTQITAINSDRHELKRDIRKGMFSVILAGLSAFAAVFVLILEYFIIK